MILPSPLGTLFSGRLPARLRAFVKEREARAARDRADRALASLARSSGAAFGGRVLVDAMWDNPNYWLRYSLLRAALGLHRADEVALIGKFHGDGVDRTLRALGIHRTLRYEDHVASDGTAADLAGRLLASTRRPEDILSWPLPFGLPGHDVYDSLLKRQRLATVDLAHPHLARDVIEILGYIEAARAVLDERRPDLVIASHTTSARLVYGPLIWLAVARGIPVLIPFGNYGVLRAHKIRTVEDIHSFPDCPTSIEIDDVPADHADRLARVGREYLEARLGGHTRDIGATYAFRRHTGAIDRGRLAARFGWDPSRPIVAVYASTWFDSPHAYGMTQFRDLADWLASTLEVARGHSHVNWLFRPHPCDEWYGGVTLKDMMPSIEETHVRLSPPEWNGAAVMRSVDALVTLQGTAGVEFAAAGKPVLVADRSWYHDRGFVKWPRSRDDYLAALARPWWEDIDLPTATRRAQVFAGWYFCRPAWHGSYRLGDDSEQDALYPIIPEMLEEHQDAVRREIATLREWYASDHLLYHTYKMKLAEAYGLPDV
jgi:hypothetical protein